MSRRALVGSILVLLVTTATPSGADPGHARPKITTFEFARSPLKSGINETLKVTAHDPNSWIYEVQARWEDENGDGGVLFAHTFCVQDPDLSDPGTPAKLKLPVSFDHPGNYHVEVRALSALKCQPGNNEKTSKTSEMDVVVRDPLTTRDDPDDSAGAFDFASIEQTQESSETSATTEIVHRVRMFQPWDNEQLGGPAYIEMYFDMDDDAETFERVLTIDFDEDDETLRASMLSTSSGQGRGYAAVSRPDNRTLEVSFPPLLLKEKVRDYRWFAFVDDGAPELCAPGSTCTDRAPDTGLLRHGL